MDQVVEAGEVAGEPEVFAHNSLEIAVPAGNRPRSRIADFDDRLLIGRSCRYHRVASTGVRRSTRPASRPQDTDEPDVRSLLTKIEAGELDAGIVYRTDVASTDGSTASRSPRRTTWWPTTRSLSWPTASPTSPASS